MNDAHIYCTEEQFAAEFNAVNEMYLKYFKIFGLEKYVRCASARTTRRELGTEVRQRTGAVEEDRGHGPRRPQRSGINYVEVPNEAAFYGPKIDVQVWSAIGREFTIATNQVDFAVPAALRPHLRDTDNTEARRRSASIARRSARTSGSSASSSSITPATSRSGSRPSRCASSRSATTNR